MRIPYVASVILLVAFALTLTWLLLVVSSPFLVRSGTLTDLSGTVGVKDNTAQFTDLPTLPKTIYSIGDVECHQIKDRSYFLNGNEMPFCSRDVGLFMGLAGAFGVVAFYRLKINPILLMLGLVPIGLDGGLQTFTDYVSNNSLRIATGIVAGAALALIIAQFMFALQDENKKSAAASAQT